MSWSPKYGKSRVTIIPEDALVMLRPLAKRALDHKVVGYTPNKKGDPTPVDAKFLFTMLDRSLSDGDTKVYRRVDTIRGAWAALFAAAGITETIETQSASTGKYKDGKKIRPSSSVPYTRHDMRRAFNVAAKKAGMTTDERSTLLGHAPRVNEEHYNGEPELDTEKIKTILNKKMLKALENAG